MSKNKYVDGFRGHLTEHLTGTLTLNLQIMTNHCYVSDVFRYVSNAGCSDISGTPGVKSADVR